MCSRIRAVLPEGVCLQSVETARGEGTDFVWIWEGEGVPDIKVGFNSAHC